MGSPLADVYVSDCEGYAIQLLRQLPIKELGIKVVFLELLERTVSSHEKVAESMSDFLQDPSWERGERHGSLPEHVR
jgi:hypothetical protein